MKTIQGKAINIKSSILGRITFKNKYLNRNDYIRIGGNLSFLQKGYAATIMASEERKTSLPYCIVDDLEEFNEGDVVLINSDGSIVFLYEINVHSNVIMATERCNHRCIMCAQPPIVNEIDKTPFNLKLISLMDKKSKEIGISGGEPTLIGDNLFVLIKQIQEKLPAASISILSNGVRFADINFAAKLARCRHRDLQIDIPIFSDIAEIHNKIVGASTFYKTIQGLYNLAQFHQQIGIRVVVQKQNYRRLPQLADFIYHNFPFVAQVAFMQLEIVGIALNNMDEVWIDPFDYNRELKEAVLLLNQRGIDSYIYNSQMCILPEELRPYSVQSISNWKDIYIDECDGCKFRGKCAGFFASNKDYHSTHIRKVVDA